MHPEDIATLIDVTRGVRSEAHQVYCDAYAVRMLRAGIKRDLARAILESASHAVTKQLEDVTPETMEIAFGDLVARPPSDASIYLEVGERLRGEAWSHWSMAVEYQMRARGIRRQLTKAISQGAERDARERFRQLDEETIAKHFPSKETA